MELKCEKCIEVMPVKHKHGGKELSRESLQTIMHIWEAELAEFQAVIWSWQSLSQPRALQSKDCLLDELSLRRNDQAPMVLLC